MDAAKSAPAHQDGEDARPRRSRSRGWALAAVAAVLICVFYAVRYEILPFVIAGAVGFVLDPLIRWLQPHMGNRRWIPATVLFLLLLALAAASAYWIGTLLADEIAQLSQSGPQMLHDFVAQVVGPQGFHLFGQTLTADSLTNDLQTSFAAIIKPETYAEGVGLGIAGVLGVFLTLVLIPYFLISGPQLVGGMIWLLPPERRPSVERMLPHIVPAMRRYLVGIATVVTLTAIAAYIGFGVLFILPHAILISLAVGALEIIPALGPFASLVLVGLSSAQQHSIGTAAGLMAYAVALRLVIDNVLGPVVLGRSAKLHPVAIILAFVVGSALFGIVGLLLAVPATACVTIVLEQYYADPVARTPAP